MNVAEPDLQEPPCNAMDFPCLLIAITIMLVGTVYPLVFARQDGSANHSLVFALLWAMSTGMVRGVGFIPRATFWKLLFSGWSCTAALVLSAWLRWWA